MPIVADGAVKVGADMAPFNRELKSGLGTAEKQATTFGSKLKGALTPGNLLGAAGLGFGIAQITSFIGDATSAAAEFQDSVSATGVIFGEEMIPQMERWGESASKNFGASKQDALQAANVIATLGKAAGLAGQDLVDFSQQMVQLGGDLASMYGGTTQDAITAVSAALRGEMEPIRRYGVILDDATLRTKAFEMGLIDTTKNALTPQQKVLASHAAIMAATGDAQGDFGRTSEGMANSQRTLAAELANVNIEIGERMMPIMLKLVNFIKDDAIPVVTGLLDAFSGEGKELNLGEIIEDEFPVDANSPLGRFAAGFNETWDGILGRGPEIRAAADKIGTSYDDMHTRVDAVMTRFGLDYKAAIDFILAENERVATSTPLGQFVAENMGGTVPFDAAVEDLVDGLPQGMEAAQEEAVAVAAQTPGALGDSLRENLDDYQDDLDALTEMAVNSVSDLRERSEIEGILASKELTDALNSDSTRTRLQAMELVNDLVADYELIAPGALAAGELVNPKLASGMQSNLQLTTAAADAIVDAAGNPIVAMPVFDWGYNIAAELARGMIVGKGLVVDAGHQLAANAAAPFTIDSEPPDHSSALYGITKWGGNIAKTLAEGMLSELGTTRSAARMLAGSLVPGFGTALPGVGSAASGGATMGNTYNVHLEDRLQARTVSEIGVALRRLGEAGLLPGSLAKP